MSLPDYYRLLEVTADASQDEIRRSYRRLARIYHPDLMRMRNDQRIKQINEAYAVLSDPAQRTRYDIQRLEEQRHIIALETMILQRKQLLRKQQMTWRQGMVGFVRELKKHIRDG